MKQDIKDKLNKLKEALMPILINASYSKKKYVTDLFSDIIDELIVKENRISILNSKLHGYTDAELFDENYSRFVWVLQAMGFNSEEFFAIRKETIDLILTNKNQLRTDMTWNKLINMNRMVCSFEALEDRYPESIEELKKYWEEIKNAK